jgi:hypothetical protein
VLGGCSLSYLFRQTGLLVFNNYTDGLPLHPYRTGRGNRSLPFGDKCERLSIELTILRRTRTHDIFCRYEIAMIL